MPKPRALPDLHALLRGSTGARYEIKAAVDDVVEILFYGVVGWDITAEQFVSDLQGIRASTIKLRMHSPGGFAFDATAIYNALVSHPARVETYIEGLAASAASLVALAGDRVLMAKTGHFMIHNAWSFVCGYASDMRKEAEVLDSIGETLIDVYSAKSGKGRAEVKALMDEETWLRGEKAVEAGFVDEIFNDPAVGDKQARAMFDLSAFNYAKVPDDLRDAGGASRPRMSEREVEHLLRDSGGYSRSEAVAFVAAGGRALSQRDAGDGSPGMDKVTAAVRRLTDRVRAASQETRSI